MDAAEVGEVAEEVELVSHYCEPWNLERTVDTRWWDGGPEVIQNFIREVKSYFLSLIASDNQHSLQTVPYI